MATAWLQYWNPEQLALERRLGSDGDAIGHTAGEQFGPVAPCDVVYILGRSGPDLLLVVRLVVSDILDQREAEAKLGSSIYNATWHLVGASTLKRLDRAV